MLAEPTRIGGLTSAIVRAGAVDIEVLAIGDEPPDGRRAIGLGFVADRPIIEALAVLRAAGIPTSVPISAAPVRPGPSDAFAPHRSAACCRIRSRS